MYCCCLVRFHFPSFSQRFSIIAIMILFFFWFDYGMSFLSKAKKERWEKNRIEIGIVWKTTVKRMFAMKSSIAGKAISMVNKYMEQIQIQNNQMIETEIESKPTKNNKISLLHHFHGKFLFLFLYSYLNSYSSSNLIQFRNV